MSTRKKANVASTDNPRPKRSRRSTPAAAAIVDISLRDGVCQQEAVGQLGEQEAVGQLGEQEAVGVAEANVGLPGGQDEEMSRKLPEQNHGSGSQKTRRKRTQYKPFYETQKKASAVKEPLPVISLESIMLEEEAEEKKKQNFGQLHAPKMNKANMRASEQILADRINDLTKYGTLDLHGLHIDDAIDALNRSMLGLKRDHVTKDILIITGRGSHSQGRISRLRPPVIAYLKKFDYKFDAEQIGAITVSLKRRKSDR